jgi:hypothetical protein
MRRRRIERKEKLKDPHLRGATSSTVAVAQCQVEAPPSAFLLVAFNKITSKIYFRKVLIPSLTSLNRVLYW